MLHKSKQVDSTPSPLPDCPWIGELKNVKYQFRVENAKFKIRKFINALLTST